MCLLAAERPDVKMIRCSNADCHLGVWFHVDCVGVDSVPDGDWWCSDECRATEQSIFCTCKVIRPDEPQVTCANVDCMNGSIFHRRCVDMPQLPGNSSETNYPNTTANCNSVFLFQLNSLLL